MRQKALQPLVCNIILFFFVGLFAFAPRASMVLPVQLEDLTKRAELVFKGNCTQKRETTKVHPESKKEIPVTVYTFKVEEVIKGSLGDVLEVASLALTTRKEALELGVAFMETLPFDVGKTYLLFLGAPNSLGIRPVIGGGFGKYVVTKDNQGKEIVENALGLPPMPKPSTEKALKEQGAGENAKSGGVSYQEFVDRIRSFNESLKE